MLPSAHPAGRFPDLPAGVHFVHGDVRAPVAVEAALAGVDVVCHQAAMVGLGVDLDDAPLGNVYAATELAQEHLALSWSRVTGGTAAAAHGGPSPVVTGDFRLGDVRHVTACSRRAHTELGWQAAIPFEAGIAEFAALPLRR